MLTALQKEQFDELGYVVIEDILPKDTFSTLLHSAELMGFDQPHRSSWNERSCFRRRTFSHLLDAPLLNCIARQLIGEDVQLLQLDLLRTRPAENVLEWHRDVNFICNKTLAISCAIYLQETTLQGGPLCVVPNSHRWEQGPPTSQFPLPDEVRIPVAAAAAVIHDSGLWHTATLNRSPVDCWGIFPIFGKFWIKRRDVDCLQPLPSDLLQTRDPLKQQLLGSKLRPGVRPYLGDGEEYNLRGDAGIDFVTPATDVAAP